MAYEVRLDTFEGPLDLLLHLIDKAEVDIYDIPLTLITEQYMKYIYVMQEFQIEIASEFLLMAATLLEIKSKMLLPRKEEIVFQPALDMDLEEYDPRAELVERLLEYKKYKKIAELFRDKETMQSQLYTRPPEDLTAYMKVEETNPVADFSLYDLVEAFTKALSKEQQETKSMAKIHRDEVSIKEKIQEIEELLVFKEFIRFTELFSGSYGKSEVVTSFMAILEMIRKQRVTCSQSTLFDEIVISRGKGVGG